MSVHVFCLCGAQVSTDTRLKQTEGFSVLLGGSQTWPCPGALTLLCSPLLIPHHTSEDQDGEMLSTTMLLVLLMARWKWSQASAQVAPLVPRGAVARGGSIQQLPRPEPFLARALRDSANQNQM